VETQGSSSGCKLRLFIAIELPDVMKDELAGVQERLRRKLKFPLKWVKPEGIHLTLKFLGGVDKDKVTALEAAISGAASAHRAIDLQLGKLGSFGGRRPRVVWVAVDGETAELAALQASVDQETARLGFEPEKRSYSAHLTLARMPEALNRLQYDEILHAVGNITPPAPTAARFHEVSLMQSTLRREGAVYTQLFTALLGRR
jgi:2'-5' RNA ligase